MTASETSATVAVIGTGYVGLTTAACLSHFDHRVVGVDIDTEKVAQLNAGIVEILEPGLPHLVRVGLDTGRLHFTTTHRDAVAAADVVFLCLPTPVTSEGDLDVSFVAAACRTIAPVLAEGAVVVTKSTVPVGTHANVQAWLGRDDVFVASNPEFLREGSAVHDFLEPDRIVVGAVNERAAQTVAGLYARSQRPVQFTDPASAELIKYAANTFLAAKLSFVNEMSRLCDRVGADIDAVTRGMSTDHRIGPEFLRPGPGWGGSCFPKDTRGMDFLAGSVDLDLPVVAATARSNDLHFDHIVAEISTLFPAPLDLATIAVWGATFKADTSDCRDSPAIEVMERLVGLGCTLRLYDPVATPAIAGVEQFDDIYTACEEADILAVLTEWSEFTEADLDKTAALMNLPLVYDTRAVIDRGDADAAGIRLFRPGVPAAR